MNNSKKRIIWWILTVFCGLSLLSVVFLGFLCFEEYLQMISVFGIEGISLTMISEPYGTGGLVTSSFGWVAAVFALILANKIPEKRIYKIVSIILLGLLVLATLFSLVLLFC